LNFVFGRVQRGVIPGKISLLRYGSFLVHAKVQTLKVLKPNVHDRIE
jgi:hypothetical protein